MVALHNLYGWATTLYGLVTETFEGASKRGRPTVTASPPV